MELDSTIILNTLVLGGCFVIAILLVAIQAVYIYHLRLIIKKYNDRNKHKTKC